MRVKMSKQPPPAPTASAVGPCPTVIQIVGRPGTGSLTSTTRPPTNLIYIGGAFYTLEPTSGFVEMPECTETPERICNITENWLQICTVKSIVLRFNPDPQTNFLF